MRVAMSHSQARKAFTLVELLVVIAVIALLAGLLIVAVGGARRAAQDTSERSRLRGLAMASATYASSNKGRLPSPRTDTPGNWSSMKARPSDCPGGDGGLREELALASNPADVKYIGWVCADNARCPGSILNDERETVAALENGSLFPYVDGTETYLSPMDNTGRLRSFSINSWVGVLYCDDYIDLPGVFKGGDYPTACSLAFDTRTLARLPKPADTAMFMADIDPFKRRGGTVPGWNFNGMLLNPNPGSVVGGDGSGNARIVARVAKWFDLPAVWSPGQTKFNMSFADGSTGSYQIQSPTIRSQQVTDRMLTSMGNNPYQGLGLLGSDPSFMDLVGLSRYVLPGLLKSPPPGE